jgi:hypothetical protein
MPEVTMLPEGIDIELTSAGDTIVHTADADISITPAGDDVIVSTRDALVEVRAELDEVIVDTAGEEIFIDTAPRAPSDLADWNKAPVVQSTDNGRSKLAIAIVAAVAALVAVLVVTRKRR